MSNLLLLTLIASVLNLASAIDTDVLRSKNSGDTTLQQLCQSLTTDSKIPPTSTTSTNTTGESTPLLLKHFGTGLDGTLVVNEAETIKVNRYARVLQISTKGSTKIEVSCTEIFTTGKEVYIIQMKGSNDSQSLFARIVYVDHKNSIITINTELTFNCNSTGNNRCQVVTVPHFENVTLKARATITAAPWNGDSGGIIVFRSKQIVHVGQTSSKISVNGIGFRGGRYGATLMQNGSHGESYAESANRSIHANYGGGGGGLFNPRGYYCCKGGGGGGAAHSSDGESPRTYRVKPAYGGKAYGISLLIETIFMGSGGGGGARNEECCALPGAGGNGGGIVMIFSPAITGSGGSISSRGARGQDAGHNIEAKGGKQGGGGGGAGGSILLVTYSFGIPVDGSVSIDLRGGIGGKESDSDNKAPGGKGSHGRFMWYKLPRLEKGPLSLH